MTRYVSWLERRIYGAPASDWVIAAGIIVATLLAVSVVRGLLKRKLRRAAETETDIDDFLADLVSRTKLWLIFFVVLYSALRHVVVETNLERLLFKTAVVASLLQVGFWGVGVVDFWLGRYRRQRFETDPGAVTTIAAFGVLGKIAIWIVVVLVALENVLDNFDLTPLVASLGIGGVAVALATQSILGDLFASLSIVLDKPFVLGDMIAVGPDSGTVEKIGLKTTRVRSLTGEQLIFSNSDLLGSRVRNFKRMMERRALFTFGVTYATPREQLEQIPVLVKEIIDARPDTRYDRAHFKRFGESALEFEVVYWMLVPEYNAFMDAQQAINLELMSRLEALGVQFAFPTRTVHVATMPGSDARRTTGALPVHQP
jgi:small-conductance mechanosensitive channel